MIKVFQPKVLNPGKKKSQGVRADELLTPSKPNVCQQNYANRATSRADQWGHCPSFFHRTVTEEIINQTGTIWSSVRHYIEFQGQWSRFVGFDQCTPAKRNRLWGTAAASILGLGQARFRPAIHFRWMKPQCIRKPAFHYISWSLKMRSTHDGVRERRHLESHKRTWETRWQLATRTSKGIHNLLISSCYEGMYSTV